MKDKTKRRWDKVLVLDGNKFYLIVASFTLAAVLHNLVYGLFKSYFDSLGGGDEAFFFIIAVIVLPLYLAICFLYTTVKVILNGTILKN